MNRQIKIGMGQMYVHPGKPEQNMEKAIEMIEAASDLGCEIIVLPECLDLGWTYPESKSLSKPIPGAFSDLLASKAKEHHIYIAAGLSEKSAEDLYNSAILINPDGEIILKHQKISELSIASHLYSKGKSLNVVSTPIGNIGLNICADNWPDSLALGHALGLMGADVILSPSAWAVEKDYDQTAKPYGDEWKQAYTELALTNNMSIIGVSNVGPVIGGAWDGWKCIGCSLAVDSSGEILTQGPFDQEQLLVVTLQ